jgi:hypothetical protein
MNYRRVIYVYMYKLKFEKIKTQNMIDKESLKLLSV